MVGHHVGGARGRGGGPGRGSGNPGDPNNQENMDLDSDGGLVNNGVVVTMARKRLVNVDGTFTERTVEQQVPSEGFVSDKILMIETNSSGVVDKSQMSTPQKIHDQKKTQTGWRHKYIN